MSKRKGSLLDFGFSVKHTATERDSAPIENASTIGAVSHNQPVQGDERNEAFEPTLSDNDSVSIKVDNPGSDCPCCMHAELPNQPSEYNYLQTAVTVGKNKRKFDKKWYKEFNWIHFCEIRKKILCFHCLWTLRKSLFIPSVKVEDSFSKCGFSSWNHLRESLIKHEKSGQHQHSVRTWQRRNTPSVTSILSENLVREQATRRVGLMKTISSIVHVCRQGQPIRGHEDEDSNLIQLLKLRGEDDPALLSYLSKKAYQSHDVIQEVMEIIGPTLLRSLLQDIRQAPFFGIIADETRDVSGKEQFAICVRWCDDEFAVFEDFIGFVETEKTDSQTLFHLIKDVLIRCQLDINKCRGQAYDGAANMSGKLNGVSKRLQSLVPAALFVHCFNHNLQLAVQDASSATRTIQDILSLCSDICNFIKLSPLRLSVFQKLKHDALNTSKSLRPLCPTRWTVRAEALSSIVDNYEVLLDTMEEVRSNPGSSDVTSKASGILNILLRFSTLFSLTFGAEVFSVTDFIATKLQAKDMDARTAQNLFEICIKQRNDLRSDEKFDEFWQKLESKAHGMDIEISAPRERKISIRRDAKPSTQAHLSTREYFKKQYFEVLDTMRVCVEKRSSTSKGAMDVLRVIESVLLDSANKSAKDQELIKSFETLKSTYPSDFDFEKLKCELKILPGVIDPSRVVHLTKLDSLCDALLSISTASSIYSETVKLLKIYYTVPMTSCSAERSFSSLRRLKTYLRQAMTQKTLNTAALCHVHRSKCNNELVKRVVSEFVTKNKNRRKFFGSFKEDM